MTTAEQDRLARLCGFRTRYEITATHPDGRRFLVCYTPRKGRRGILHALQSRLEDGSLDRVIQSREVNWGRLAAHGCRVGEWYINFSGRTQRESYIGGELTFLADVA